MPVGKIYPEDFAGRANRDDHAGRLVFHILGAIDEFHGLEGRSVQPLAPAMILAGPPVISV